METIKLHGKDAAAKEVIIVALQWFKCTDDLNDGQDTLLSSFMLDGDGTILDERDIMRLIFVATVGTVHTTAQVSLSPE